MLRPERSRARRANQRTSLRGTLPPVPTVTDSAARHEPARIDGPHVAVSDRCEPILRELPDWFGIEEATAQYVRDIETLPTFLASIGDLDIGFLSIRRHFDTAAEMHVLGILPQYHRRGIGRAMVRHAEQWLAESGVRYLQVKTLSPSRPCEHYERTRQFYLALGFVPLEEFPTLWDERNPCLQMIKVIS